MFAMRTPNATPADLEEERRRNMEAAGMEMPPEDLHDGPDDMERRGPHIEREPGETEPADRVALFAGEPVAERDAPPDEAAVRRHAVLMDTLDEESERQAEERHQAQVDHDYYDHLQWTQKDAEELSDRGQAPLVFNEARASIDWLTGTERRLRKDYKIRPRERGDEKGAEAKTKVFKYVDDVNNAAWNRSRAAKDMFISGLGWIEEAINVNPEKELLYCGYEDWRRIIRDSRGREFDLEDGRFLHRRKPLDLDYAMALLPKGARHLQSVAGRSDDEEDATEVWYLGERLTNAHSFAGTARDGLFGPDYSVRRTSGQWDRGRRNIVDLIESWYRVPETVQVFAAGPLRGKIANPADPAHAQLMRDRTRMYSTVKMRMRVMIGTKYAPIWDGPSPFRHGKFLLVPLWGYRRGRDGLMYGQMRGMRDPQDDLNKRRSKALFALSSNRILMTSDAAPDDLEEFRQEMARADGIGVVNGSDLAKVRLEKFMGDVQMNMEMAEADRMHIRNAGGVTGENLGEKTNAASGRAIIAKQEQGSLTTFELFDQYFLAFKLAGQIRLSHIEQFCNQQWTFRIDPANKPEEWVTVNEMDPRTGEVLNDITRAQADFIVDQQDYRATLTQAAMESMFELLGSMATFAPQVVLNLLDLVVDSSDVPGKEEWVSRIRKMTGQRDPSKAPTPEELAADQARAAKEQEVEAITIGTAKAKMAEILSKINKTNADKVMSSLQGLLSAVEAAATIAQVPAIAPAADALARSAGFVDATPADGVMPPKEDPGSSLPMLPAPEGAQPAPLA